MPPSFTLPPAATTPTREHAAAPFRTIQHAADLAQPGDVITVHEGVYRERISPPRGGGSDAEAHRLSGGAGREGRDQGVGSRHELGEGQEDVWKATLPNAFFGSFNPYSDLIHGDWFNPKGRPHHTGAVYLNGEWLTEAAELDKVLEAGGKPPRCGSPRWTRPTPRSGRSSRASTPTNNWWRSTCARRCSIRRRPASTSSPCAASPCGRRPRLGRRRRPSRSA